MAWKTLPSLLAQHKVQLHNYPDGVVPPGDGEGSGKGKGIAGLKLADLNALLEAFEGANPPKFELAKKSDYNGEFHCKYKHNIETLMKNLQVLPIPQLR